MSNIFKPFDNQPLNFGCTCGKHRTQNECNQSISLDERFTGVQTQSQVEHINTDMIEAVAVKALFPHEPTRRAFLKSVGKGAAMAAIASVLPLAMLQEAAAVDILKPEKKSVDIGFFADFVFYATHHG